MLLEQMAEAGGGAFPQLALAQRPDMATSAPGAAAWAPCCAACARNPPIAASGCRYRPVHAAGLRFMGRLRLA